jgi:hypothetical protein
MFLESPSGVRQSDEIPLGHHRGHDLPLLRKNIIPKNAKKPSSTTVLSCRQITSSIAAPPSPASVAAFATHSSLQTATSQFP